MGRYTEAGVAVEELKNMIDDAGGVHEVLGCNRTTKINVDLSKIEFDCEKRY